MALRLLPAVLLAAALLSARAASAQTWADDRSTPALRELVAVDQTGEPNWLFGTEDVAGDGPATFNAPEQAADLRSAYAATQRDRLWLRIYVSAQSAPQDLRSFVFIDTDDDARTGGSARAPDIDPSLDTDAASNGYEVVLAWPSNGPLAAWRWVVGPGNGNMSRYESVTDLMPLDPQTERGTDPDPLELNAPRNGYVQASLKFAPIDLSVACAAKLLFRSSSGTLLRDRDLGQAGACRPSDANDNHVSDVVETRAACTTDAQCPGHGTCDEGVCAIPAAAAGPDEVVLAPGDVVQGGAFTCAAAPSAARHGWLGMAALGALLGTSRLRRCRRGRAAC